MSEEQATYQAGGRVTSDPQRVLSEVTELSGYYAMIPEELISMGNGNAMLVYAALDRIARKPDCYASNERVSQATGLSLQTVRRARNWLAEQGFIEVVRVGTGHRATDYHLPLRTKRNMQLAPLSPVDPRDTNIPPQGYQNSTPGVSAVISHRETNNRETNNRETNIQSSIQQNHEKPEKRITLVDDAFREQMRQRFGPVFGDTVQERIDEALAHKAAERYHDLQAYVRGWLRRDAERLSPLGTASSNGKGNEENERAKFVQYAKELEARRANAAAG